MKKLLAIVVLGLLLSGNVYAETIESSDKHIWIYLPKGTPKNEAFSKRGIQYAKDHCIKHKKNTYSFSEGKNHDYDRLGFGRYQFRFICAKNRNEAIELLEFLASSEGSKGLAAPTFEHPLKGVNQNQIVKNFGEFIPDSVTVEELGENNSLAIKLMKDAGWN